MATKGVLKLTMQQLVDMALGTPTFTAINTFILHSALDLLLQQLNCENEIVSISGYEAKQMEEILKMSNITPIVFKTERFETVSVDRNLLLTKEQDLDKIGNSLITHLSDLQHGVVEDLSQPCGCIEKRQSICEHLCSTSDADIKLVCNMLEKSKVMQSLIVKIMNPIRDRILTLERKVKVFQRELCKCMSRVNKLASSIDLINICNEELQAFEKDYKDFKIVFMLTVEELQENVDAKFNGCHLLQMRSSLSNKLEQIYSTLSDIERNEQLKEAAGVVLVPHKSTVQKGRKYLSAPCKCGDLYKQLAMDTNVSEKVAKIKLERIARLLDTRGRKSNRSTRSKI